MNTFTSARPVSPILSPTQAKPSCSPIRPADDTCFVTDWQIQEEIRVQGLSIVSSKIDQPGADHNTIGLPLARLTDYWPMEFDN